MTRPTRMLMAVATGIVALASASTATAAPRPQRLAFGADVQGNVDVYTVRTDGSGLRRLTDSRHSTPALATPPTAIGSPGAAGSAPSPKSG